MISISRSSSHLINLQEQLPHQFAFLSHLIYDCVCVQSHQDIFLSGHQHKGLQFACWQLAPKFVFDELECGKSSHRPPGSGKGSAGTCKQAQGDGRHLKTCWAAEEFGSSTEGNFYRRYRLNPQCLIPHLPVLLLHLPLSWSHNPQDEMPSACPTVQLNILALTGDSLRLHLCQIWSDICSSLQEHCWVV